jgi:predicted small metal-binding protein
VRVIECQFCGEVLSGSDDDDLVRAIERHMADQHSETGVDSDRARAMVERSAYDATDS